MTRLPDPYDPLETAKFVPPLDGGKLEAIRDKVRTGIISQDVLQWPKEVYIALQHIACAGYERDDATLILQTHQILSMSEEIPPMVWTYILRIPLVGASRLILLKEKHTRSYLNPVKRIAIMDEQIDAIVSQLRSIEANLNGDGYGDEDDDRDSDLPQNTKSLDQIVGLRAQLAHFQKSLLDYLRLIQTEQQLLDEWVGVRSVVQIPTEVTMSQGYDAVSFAPTAVNLEDSDTTAHHRMIANKSSLLEGLKGLFEKTPEELREKVGEFKTIMGEGSLVPKKSGGGGRPKKVVKNDAPN